MSSYVFVGWGGHAVSCLEVLFELDRRLLGYIAEEIPSSEFPCLGTSFDIALAAHPSYRDANFFVAVGSNELRARLADDVSSLDLTPSSPLVSAHAYVADNVHVGHGSIVMPGAVVRRGATIGNHVIVNSGTVIDHDCRVQDFAHVAPNATLTGKVVVGRGAFVGAGATVIPGIRVGDWVTVAAGAAVVRDVDSGLTVGGVPSRDLHPGRS